MHRGGAFQIQIVVCYEMYPHVGIEGKNIGYLPDLKRFKRG